MGAAAVEFHVFNGRAADHARRPFPPIDAEVFLVLPFFPVAANEVPYRRPAVFEAFVEDVRNGFVELRRFFLGDPMGPAQGPDTGAEQGFVDVDVADTGHLRLVEKDRLDRPARFF